MNTTRSVVSDDDLLQMTEAELLEGFNEQNVVNVKRIKMRRDGKEIATKHLILIFISTVMPESIESGYINLRVRPYVPNPLRCFKCQRFGHSSQSCRGRQTGAKCSAHEHTSEACGNALHCVNCDREHATYSRSCPSWKKEKEIVTIEVKENTSFKEARRRVTYLPKKTFADVTCQGAASQRPPAPVGPTSIESAVTPSAPTVVAASAAPPTEQKGPSTPKMGAAEAAPTSPAPCSAGNGRRSQIPQGAPSTSWLVGAGVLTSEAGSFLVTSRSQEHVFGVAQEAMDTTPFLKAHQEPKRQRVSLERSKKGHISVTGPGKSSVN
ncbi:uncharacterized protein [Dermacentor albipictus]|uniref:uncharacterized protein n=1 Tax=Dermacentor albipictus TaxID=60249 RepID=UPI0038FC3D82